jgi:hypothetical protein
VKLTPRKLLSAAVLATVAACGHAAPATHTLPVAMAVPMPVPVSEPAVATTVAATPDVVVATPMCDANGRPLAGNVRTKTKETMADCTTVTASR